MSIDAYFVKLLLIFADKSKPQLRSITISAIVIERLTSMNIDTYV